MKQVLILLFACVLASLSCQKDPSNGGTTPPVANKDPELSNITASPLKVAYMWKEVVSGKVIVTGTVKNASDVTVNGEKATLTGSSFTFTTAELTETSSLPIVATGLHGKKATAAISIAVEVDPTVQDLCSKSLLLKSVVNQDENGKVLRDLTQSYDADDVLTFYKEGTYKLDLGEIRANPEDNRFITNPVTLEDATHIRMGQRWEFTLKKNEVILKTLATLPGERPAEYRVKTYSR